jgi:hypothetical protein
MKRKKIILSPEERAKLKQFSKTGVRSIRLVNRARVILALDTSGGKKAEKQEDIARHIGVSRQTVNNAKNDFLALHDVSLFLRRKKRETPPVPPKTTGELEARVIALACGEVPEGCARWTLRLLADKCVELHYIDALSPNSVRRLLRKTNFNLI